MELSKSRDAANRKYVRCKRGHTADKAGGRVGIHQCGKQHASRRRKGTHPNSGIRPCAGDNDGNWSLHESRPDDRGAGIHGGNDLGGQRNSWGVPGISGVRAATKDPRDRGQSVWFRIFHKHRALRCKGGAAAGRHAVYNTCNIRHAWGRPGAGIL